MHSQHIIIKKQRLFVKVFELKKSAGKAGAKITNNTINR